MLHVVLSVIIVAGVIGVHGAHGRETRSRNRYCINPRTKYGGKSCEGKYKELMKCDIQPVCTGTCIGVLYLLHFDIRN